MSNQIYYAIEINKFDAKKISKIDPERLARLSSCSKKYVIYGLTQNLVKYVMEQIGISIEKTNFLIGTIEITKKGKIFYLE